MTTKRVDVKENWKPAVGCDGYEVSDLGGFQSITRRVPYGTNGATKRVVGKRIKPFIAGNNGGRQGNLVVQLGRARRVKLHHVVLETFVGPRPLGAIGLHADDNPYNNSAANLSWGTHSQNLADSWRNGRRTG